MVRLRDFVELAPSSALSSLCDQTPWSIVVNVKQIVHDMLAAVDEAFDRQGEIAIHRTATIEAGAVIKGPAIIGAQCFIAAGSYLRGGVWLGEGCTVGPGVELKSSFVFRDTRLAHFNFVGDTILGSGVNLEAGSVIANSRNERADGKIRVRSATGLHAIDVKRFGALVGDRVRIGANAVIAPGSLIRPDQIIARMSLVDQDSE